VRLFVIVSHLSLNLALRSAFLNVDCGNEREGTKWDGQRALDVAKIIKDNEERISFQGVYAHCGNSYLEPTTEGVQHIRDETARRLCLLRDRLQKELLLSSPTVGLGSTPSCSLDVPLPVDVKALNEFHPGNYAFYDAQQKTLNSCREEDVACRVLTRVLSVSDDGRRLLVDCGWTGLTTQGFEGLDGSFAIIEVCN